MSHFTLMTDDILSASDALSQTAKPSQPEMSLVDSLEEEPVLEACPDGDEPGVCETPTIEPEEADQHPQEVDESPDRINPVQEETERDFQQADEGTEQIENVQAQTDPRTEHVEDPEQADERMEQEEDGANEGTEQGDAAHDEELHIPEAEPVMAAEATAEAPPDLSFDAELSDAFNEASPVRKRVSAAPLCTIVESIQKGNQVLSSIVNQLRQINADIRRVPTD
jgi:hypothetical protein